MTATSGRAIWIVMVCAALWGFWWYPVGLLESAGLSGPWIGMGMSAAVLPISVLWALTRRGEMSARAVTGALLVGVAVTLYAMAASYTDFLRAVLLFYLAPAWSTLIELCFFRRRWTWASGLAIAMSLAGVLLISRGEISFDGLGAIGDWMALGSGLTWSIGVAMIFAARRAEVSRVMVLTGIGGITAAALIGALDGSLWAGLPTLSPDWQITGFAAGFAIVYIGIILAGTMWGAFRLPPVVMTYLLSLEVIGGVLSSTLILGERFGLFEIGGAICILGAILIEVVWTERTPRPT